MSVSDTPLIANVTEQPAASGPVTVLSLKGSAGIIEAGNLTVVCNRLAAARPKRIVVDMTELTFACSLTLGSIVSLHHALKLQDATLELAAPTPLVMGVLEPREINTFLTIHPTLKAALKA